MSLVDAINGIVFWGPIVTFVVGAPSAVFTAVLFSRVKAFRRSPSSCHVIGQSLFDFAVLLLVLLQIIPATSISSSSVACKLMIYLSQVAVPCAMSFHCLSTFDRWACTSRSAKIRQLSSVDIARRMFFVPILFWLLINIPYLIYCDVVWAFQMCLFTNEFFAKVSLFFLGPIFSVIFPLITLIVFGFLAHRNVHKMTALNAQQHALHTRLSMWEQQITRMTIVQTILNIFCTFPRSVFVIYTIATVEQRSMRSLEQILIESLIDQLTVTIMCLDFASSFYIFFLCSPRFRQTVLMCLRRLLRLPPNQITPVSQCHPTAAFTVSKQYTRAH